MKKQEVARKAASPKPFMIAGYSLIALTFGVMGGWAATAKLDRAVIASGVIDVESNRKEIQHLEGGIIEQILATEGQVVNEGDTLVRLNAVQAASNLQVINIRLRIAQAMEARLQAERRMAETVELPETLANDETPEIRAAVEDQLEIFRDRTSILTSQVDILNNRIAQLHRESEGLSSQRAEYEERVRILSEQLDRLRRGHESGVVQSNTVSAYEEEYVEVRANVARMETEIAKVEKSIGETELQILQTQQQYRERASSEYKETSGQIQELIEHIKVARDVLARTEIRAPVGAPWAFLH